jgi:hypothetical protein
MAHFANCLQIAWYRRSYLNRGHLSSVSNFKNAGWKPALLVPTGSHCSAGILPAVFLSMRCRSTLICGGFAIRRRKFISATPA